MKKVQNPNNLTTQLTFVDSDINVQNQENMKHDFDIFTKEQIQFIKKQKGIYKQKSIDKQIPKAVCGKILSQ